MSSQLSMWLDTFPLTDMLKMSIAKIYINHKVLYIKYSKKKIKDNLMKEVYYDVKSLI